MWLNLNTQSGFILLEEVERVTGYLAMRVPLSLILIPTTRSFSATRQHARPRSMCSMLEDAVMGARGSSTAPDINQSTPDPVIFTQNFEAHMKVVCQSEETFYGYFPNGFDAFDTENAPLLWKSYILETCHDKEYSMSRVGSASNIWDAFTQLDKRIIPPPFTPNDLARVSLSPILSPQECKEIIDECEQHYWGWSSSNERYGTPSHRVGHMLKLESLSRSYTLVNFELLPRLFPAVINAFPYLKTNAANLRLAGCRVVKYDASDGHVELGLHRDGQLLTANIALNDIDEYENGGTYVEGLPHFMSNPIRLKKGHCLLHPGDVKHGGAAISKGVRYVLVCFLLDTTIIPHEKYCHDRMQANINAARLIPAGDQSRSKERSDLLAGATKHCADAFAFGRMDHSEATDNGYQRIVNEFSSFIQPSNITDAVY